MMTDGINLPKPVLPIGKKPLAWHVMRIYAHYGFKRYVICLGHKADVVRQEIERAVPAGWDVEFANTGMNTPTGGRVKMAERFIDGDEFFCTYADGVSDVDITKLLAFHRRKGKIATLVAVRPQSPFGALELKDGAVKKFREKPMLSQYINGGFFVFKNGIFDYLDDNIVLEREPLETLAKKGQLAAYKHHGFWRCMDTFKDYANLKWLWQSDERCWKVWRH